MKILIIDNGSRYVSELITFAEDNHTNQVSVAPHDQIDRKLADQTDMVILSGSQRNPVSENPHEYEDEIALVRTRTKPLIGICMGFEIIAYAYGSQLERMHNKESRRLPITKQVDSPILRDIESITVPEHHRWHVKVLGSGLIPIATSKDGVEIIKDERLPIYGFQFHPELDMTNGTQLLHNICIDSGIA